MARATPIRPASWPGSPGSPRRPALYLDLDTGCTSAYFTAWVAEVQARGFIPGVTGTPEAIAGLGELGIDLAHWCFARPGSR